MSVLITGASGLLGSHLVERLGNRCVIALIRDVDMRSEFFRKRLNDRVTVVQGDLADERLVERVIVQYEVEKIFHLGAQTIVGNGVRQPLETFESNIRGTYLLLEAARTHRHQIGHIVIASSDKAYGSAEQLPYTEEMPLQGVGPYDVSKSCCDLLAQSYLRTYKLPIAIARCGNLFGAGDLNNSRLIPGTIQSLLNKEAPLIRSDGGSLRDYLYVKDAVTGYLMLSDQRVCGAYNFGPGTPQSVLDVVRTITGVMGSDIEPMILNTAKGEIRNQYLDASKARTDLGWEIKYSFEEALEETVAWYTGAVFAER